MFAYANVAKLGAVHTVEPMVLSVYLSVPEDPGELRTLAARADELIVAAEEAAGPGRPPPGGGPRGPGAAGRWRP